MAAKKLTSRIKKNFGLALANEPLTELKAQLQSLKSARPLVKREDGRYEGDILGFVKGLRLSAGLIHFLDERLEGVGVEVSWGHLLDDKKDSCSPECDVIIHSRGAWRRWNGRRKSIMEFKFIEVAKVRAVVSCKSQLSSIDKRYAKDLKKFGVNKVFLFAECCSAGRFVKLSQDAKKAGYCGLCCLYFTGAGGAFQEVDPKMWMDFANLVSKAVQ